MTSVFASPVRVVYRKDGGVSVITPVSSDNTATTFEKTMNESPDLKGCEYKDMDSSELPLDRADRDYWTKKEDGGIKIDETKKNNFLQNRQKKEQDKKSVEDKLKTLGLTKDEISAIIE